MILDLFKLDGKVALVTGASRGIGRGLALALAEAGADVFITDISGADSVLEELRGRGRRAASVKADLSDAALVPTIAQACVKEMGRLDIVINNAGIIRRAPLLEFSEKDWDDVLMVNLKAMFLLSQAAARIMIGQGNGGRIINTASLLSFQGGILVPSYTAAKSGVAGLTRALANELAPHAITVNAIAPGYIATDNTKALREDPVRSKAILERIPLGRWGSPEDLQGAVIFLASECARYVTGSIVTVDGGWMAR
jgi:2-deoxy-D-gluconate 3-dehydrogenase